MPRVLVLFFFLSGFSALIYEVAWLRELSLSLGNTAQATSVVLAVFMGGLSLGSFFGGKLADKSEHEPFAVYGALEIGISLLALVTSAALNSSAHMYSWLAHNIQLGAFGLTVVRLLMSSGLLLLPTILMGATLPVLVRYLEKHQLPVRFFSILYGLNTLGAAAGSMLACFLGFTYIGIQGTLYCAASINLIIGALSILLSRQEKYRSAFGISADSTSNASLPGEEDNGAAPAANGMSLRILCLISFLGGFTALSYEVLWTRILRWYFTSITYSFTIMVSMFLLGLAIGSLIYERLLQKSPWYSKNPYVIQYLAALVSALSLPLFPFWSLHSHQLLDMVAPSLPILHSQTLYQICYIFMVATPTIMVPAILIGILFPLIGTLAASSDRARATAVGIVYAFNTVGCIFGSLICGLLLMPIIGSRSTFQWTVFLSAITGALMVVTSKNLPLNKKLALTILPLALAGFFLTLHFHSSLAPGSTLLLEAEDTTGVLRVIDFPKRLGILLEQNGSSLASTTPANLRYMRLMAHLPLLLHAHPETVLLACYGTGTTAGAASIYPELKHLDIVELSKTVLEAAQLFKKTNYNVLRNSKVKVHVNDIRSYLLVDDTKYDVITFEPPPPTYAGVVNLYSEEFYKLVDQHLKENGLVCQWIPMNQVSTALWKMQIASARAVFPYVSIWLPNHQQAILLAGNEPLKIDIARMQGHIDASPIIKESLAEVGFDNANEILSTFVATGSALDDYTKNSVSITDNYPRLEFYLPYAGESPTELEAEGIGNTDVKQFALAIQHSRGFNADEFWKSWQAIHMLRQIQNLPHDGIAQSNQYIQTAANLRPNNKWFSHLQEFGAVSYPTNTPNYRPD